MNPRCSDDTAGRGRSAGATGDEHVRRIIEEVFFIAPGDWVNRRYIGVGLRRLVVAPFKLAELRESWIEEGHPMLGSDDCPPNRFRAGGDPW